MGLCPSRSNHSSVNSDRVNSLHVEESDLNCRDGTAHWVGSYFGSGSAKGCVNLALDTFQSYFACVAEHTGLDTGMVFEVADQGHTRQIVTSAN